MTDVNSPVRIGNKIAKNRIAMAPTVKFYAGDDGMVTEEFVRHYEERAKHDCGIIVLEATCVEKEARLAPTQLGLWCDEQIEGHSKIADAVHKYGALVMPQLHHGGLGTHPDCGPITSPTKMMWKVGEEEVEARELSVDDIKRVIDEFALAALRAQKAGYDGVQIHACHQYLINDFASKLNKRSDEYGGSVENKARLGSDIIKAIRAVAGADFIISARISGADPTIEDSIIVAQQYVLAGCDYLQVSTGFGNFDNIRLEEGAPYNKIAALGVHMHEYFKGRIPVSLVNGFRDRDSVRYMFENDLTDTIDLGCSLLADPAFSEAILYDKPYVKCFSCAECGFGPRHSHPCPAYVKRGVSERF